MSKRDECPSCGSHTALGQMICFKCGYVCQYGKPTAGFLLEFVQQTNTVLAIRDNVVMAPREFPHAPLKWLYQAGIYDETIIRQRIGYCPDIHKVLVPAFDSENNLMFYQLRSLDETQKAKYITYGSTHIHTILYNDFTENKTLLICEDHLSGIRLRKHMNVLSLSGTTLSLDVISKVLTQYDSFIFWLDPDEPGKAALHKNHVRLNWHANKSNIKRMFLNKTPIEYKFNKVNYNIIVHDPKCYYDHEIKNILRNKVVQI